MTMPSMVHGLRLAVRSPATAWPYRLLLLFPCCHWEEEEGEVGDVDGAVEDAFFKPFDVFWLRDQCLNQVHDLPEDAEDSFDVSAGVHLPEEPAEYHLLRRVDFLDEDAAFFNGHVVVACRGGGFINGNSYSIISHDITLSYGRLDAMPLLTCLTMNPWRRPTNTSGRYKYWVRE